MKLRIRVARTVGFNVACLALTLGSLWFGAGLLAPYLVRHGLAVPTVTFTNWK